MGHTNTNTNTNTHTFFDSTADEQSGDEIEQFTNEEERKNSRKRVQPRTKTAQGKLAGRMARAPATPIGNGAKNKVNIPKKF